MMEQPERDKYILILIQDVTWGKLTPLFNLYPTACLHAVSNALHCLQGKEGSVHVAAVAKSLTEQSSVVVADSTVHHFVIIVIIIIVVE